MNSLKSAFFLLILFCFGCNSEQKPDKSDLKGFRQLEDIIKSDTLKAITTYSGTTYFLYKGKAMGFEYDILKMFADHLGVELKMIIAKDENKLIEMLNSGKGDLIAYGYTITEDRKQKIDFSEPLYLSHQVLVQKKPKNWRRMKLHNIKKKIITNPIQLLDDTISVKKNSSYAHRLFNLSNELGGTIHIDTIPGNTTTDEIFKKIADGELKYSIVDQNLASIYSSDYPILDISTKLSLSQRIAWGLRKNSNALKDSLNNWLNENKDNLKYRVVYNKYFKNRRSFRKRVKSEFYSLNDKKISPYDDLIKKYAGAIGWDWRLVASVAYQESQFKPTEESIAGARGLMQIMPKTAESLEISDPTDPGQSLRGGTAYLSELWEDHNEIQDSLQRIKFTLASYNAGPYHVKDAQRLAEHLDLDPNRWDNNVENAIVELSKPEFYTKDFIKYGYVRGKQPFLYVRDIFKRYDHYKAFVPIGTAIALK